MTYQSGGDLCLGFWAEAWNSGVLQFPQGAKVLEIGCAEADWMTPMLTERPDLRITGIDWRECQRPGETLRDDVLVHEFPAESFDAIVGVSSIEHIGLGSYESDPPDPEGDRHTVEKCYTWCKPGGWLYLDVPYRPEGSYYVTGNFRAYDEAAIQSRLIVGGWQEVWRKVVGVGQGDGPYLCLLLKKV